VLRALSSPNLDIRRKTLDIGLDLITSRNIDEVRAGPRGRGLAPC
jgi:coatomer subunit beta